MKKNIKHEYAQSCPDAIGEEIEPVASAAFHQMFLHQFGKASIGDADDKGKDDGFFSVG